jgi:hypothetical protein
MITVLAVLRSGGVYTPEWVTLLRDGIRRHSTAPHRFVCLSDVDVPGVEVMPLRHDWPRWWAKVEMFAPWNEVLGRTFYVDLDTVPVNNIDDFLRYSGEACIARDFNFGVPSQLAVNYAPGAYRHLWDAFMSDPEGWMADGDRMISPHFGDQVLMTKAHMPRPSVFWQDVLPGQLVSYKVDCRGGVLPSNARLVALHGKPKQCDFPEHHWISKAWRAAA